LRPLPGPAAARGGAVSEEKWLRKSGLPDLRSLDWPISGKPEIRDQCSEKTKILGKRVVARIAAARTLVAKAS
jgi:hypothetical protein